jgi:hypothetical protein
VPEKPQNLDAVSRNMAFRLKKKGADCALQPLKIEIR